MFKYVLEDIQSPWYLADNITQGYYNYTKIIEPVKEAWEELIYGHEEGFIVYLVKDGHYLPPTEKHYAEKLRRWNQNKKAPRRPPVIGKDLAEKLFDQELPYEFIQHIFKALGFKKIPGLSKDEKIEKLTPIIENLFSNLHDK